MNWANSFFQNDPETLSTDGGTDRRTDIGVNPVYPIPPLVEQGYNEEQGLHHDDLSI